MADVLNIKQRSYNMSQIKSRDTKPELTLRKLLTISGIRNYRLHSKKIIGKPDIVFPRLKIIIFIDGCQWHKCKKHYVPPKTKITPITQLRITPTEIFLPFLIWLV